jgi:hypothetical protein
MNYAYNTLAFKSARILCVPRDGAENGRLLVLHLHPWLIGQPFRIRYLNRALEDMMRREGVWVATGSEIVAWYRNHLPSGR